MWLVVNAVYKKSKVSNSSSGMNKCASVTLRAKDVWLDIYLKYPVGGRANGTITKNNVRLADLKAMFYAAVAQVVEHATFNRVVRGSSPRGRTSQEQCPRLNCIGPEWLNKSFLSVVRNAFI